VISLTDGSGLIELNALSNTELIFEVFSFTLTSFLKDSKAVMLSCLALSVS
jgi:hypothetical protein